MVLLVVFCSCCTAVNSLSHLLCCCDCRLLRGLHTDAANLSLLCS